MDRTADAGEGCEETGVLVKLFSGSKFRVYSTKSLPGYLIIPEGF
jgi:hypothetical protein